MAHFLAFIFISLSLFHQYGASPVIQQRDNSRSAVSTPLNIAATGTGTGSAGVSISVLPPFPTTNSTSRIAAGSGFLTTSIDPSSIPRVNEGSLSIPTSAPNSPVPVSGTWSIVATEPTVALPSYHPPSSTITGAAVTSEAVQLSGLFFAIHANRNHITDSKFKQQYINNVKKAKQETDSLLNSLKVKPEADTDCSNLKRKRNAVTERDLRLLISKRSIISGLTDLVKDAANLVSCASKVVDNLVKAVEDPLPPISEIENLTDTLIELGKDLQEEDNKPSGSKSVSQQSTTGGSSSTSAASPTCTASSAVAQCTETVTLSTSFFSGATGSSTVQSITTEVCTTINGCEVSPTTAFTTVSTVSATPTGDIICAIDCAECRNSVVKKDNLIPRGDALEQRSLGDPSDFDSKDQYVMDQLEEFPGAEELMHRTTGLRSSAMTRNFEKTARRLSVSGLIGCTSVVIISEIGVWFSHHWEREQFLADDATFQTEVLGTIENGDPASLVAMPGAFSLADGDGILNPKYNVQIFISTPKDRTTGTEIYESRVDKIVDLLTGAEKPWAGIEPIRRGYLKPRPNTTDERNFEKRANSKVLIEYDNNQEAPYGQVPKANQQAIYRVWLEQQSWEHQWDAKAGVQKDASCSRSNQKREDGGSCSQPAASSGFSGASALTTVASTAGAGTQSTLVTVTRTSSNVLTTSATFGAPTTTPAPSWDPSNCMPVENPRYYLSAMVCSCNDGHTYETIATPGVLGACGFSTSPGPFLSTMPIVTPAPTPENPSFTTTFAAQPSPTTTVVDDTDDGGDSGTGDPVLDAAGNVVGGAVDAAGDVVDGAVDAAGDVVDGVGDVFGLGDIFR